MPYSVPYRYADLTFDIPWGADVADLPTLSEPVGDFTIPPIDLRGDTQAVIVFTDATRHSPDKWFAEKILAALPLPPEKVTFLCAIGMHRPSTYEEKLAKLGGDIVSRYTVLDHNPAEVVMVGEIDGIPVQVNPLLVQPGTFLVMTGVVEPHQYAGYSGGAKTAVIGCGGAETISQTHGTAMLYREGVRLGQVEGNPFQDFVRQAGVMVGVDLVVNAVMPEEVAYVGYGGMEVHDELVAKARALYEVPVPNAPYDVVIAGVGSPKDANLYQSTRAATYIGLSAAPVLRDGGVIIVPASMPEGAGAGQGERNFYEMLQRFQSGTEIISYLRQNPARAGEQRSFMMAQLLSRYDCIFVGADDPEMVMAAGLRHASTMEVAIQAAAGLLKMLEPKTLVVPHALKVLPRGA